MTARKSVRALGIIVAVTFCLSAYGLPVKPDVEKILKQQEHRSRRYEPARAGWDGPEMVSSRQASPNPVYEAYGPASTVRAIRNSLKAAATPDPVSIAAILFLIWLLRVSRRRRALREQPAVIAMPQAPIQEERRIA